MPGLTQVVVFKYSFQILPMANPAWYVLVLWESWFSSVFSWQLRRAVSQQMSLSNLDNQGKRSVFLLWIHLAQRMKVGSSSPPMALQPLCMVTRLGLSHIPEEYVSEMVAPQLVHAHKHLPPLPGFAGTQGWGAKAPSPLRVDSKESYIIAPWKRRELENMELSEKAII